MDEYFEDESPTYSQVEWRYPAIVTENATSITVQNTGYSDHELNLANRHATRFSGEIGNHHAVSSEGIQETTDNNNNNNNMGKCSALNSFKGFIDVMHENKKLPWSFRKNIGYKAGLLAYFFSNFVYSVFAAANQEELRTYHLTYVFITIAGFVAQFIITLLSGLRSDTKGSATSTSDKAKSVLIDYVVFSLGEFLIYPTLICTLYGLINERAWRFDNGISVGNFLFFLYSVIMDAIYLKTYLIFLVKKIVFSAYKKYYDLSPPTDREHKDYYISIYLTMVRAMLTALTHWLMIGIIGVRIYVDNFTPDKDDTNDIIPDTGEYKVTPFTGYMIVCTVYLPIVSWITYIILNKLWFYEVYSAIYQLSNGADCMSQRKALHKKLFAFIKDPLAYTAIVFLIGPFIAFTVGACLLDYDSSDYEVSQSARNVTLGLGTCFIIGFIMVSYKPLLFL